MFVEKLKGARLGPITSSSDRAASILIDAQNIEELDALELEVAQHIYLQTITEKQKEAV